MTFSLLKQVQSVMSGFWRNDRPHTAKRTISNIRLFDRSDNLSRTEPEALIEGKKTAMKLNQAVFRS